MTTDTAGAATQDVIDLLLDQHEVVKALMTRVAADRGADRDTAFAALADLLERHELGEQAVVHPAVKELEAREIAGERMTEEQAADKDLAELRKLGVDSPEFDARFSEFRSAVLAHAEREEQVEFPLLRQTLDGDVLMRMAIELREAQGLA